MRLGDIFPEDLKDDFAAQNLAIGSVIKLHVKDTNPPKEKRFVVVGFSENKLIMATVYINSKINEKVNWAQELKDQHILLKAEGRNYLFWDSYVDCSKLTPRDYIQIKNAIKARPDAILGKLSENDWKIIKNTILKSPTIRGKHKKKFGFYD